MKWTSESRGFGAVRVLKRRFGGLCVAGFLLFTSSLALAEVPLEVYFSGRLGVESGAPVNASVIMTIALYDSESASSGETPLFERVLRGVDIVNGRFNVSVEIPIDILQVGDVYVGISLGQEPEMTPRFKLGSVPYAVLAQHAEEAASLDGLGFNDFFDHFASYEHTHGAELARNTCSAGQVLSWTGSQWICETSVYEETDPVFVAHPAHGITSARISNWDAAFSWGDHAGLYHPQSWTPAWSDVREAPSTLAGYGITDAMSTAHPANAVSIDAIDSWSEAYGWGNHEGLYLPLDWVPTWEEIADYPAGIDADGIIDGAIALAKLSADECEGVDLGVIRWDAASEQWVCSDASLADESDPVFVASPAHGIESSDIDNWNAAFGWGDHSTAGYLSEESDPVFDAHVASDITGDQVTNWDAAHGWGDHSTAGYGTGSVTEIAAGDGMDFAAIETTGAVTLGLPGTLDITTANALSGSSHTHLIDTVLPSSPTGGIMHASGSKQAGGFYGGEIAPSELTRLNYDGNLHATGLFATNMDAQFVDAQFVESQFVVAQSVLSDWGFELNSASAAFTAYWDNSLAENSPIRFELFDSTAGVVSTQVTIRGGVEAGSDGFGYLGLGSVTAPESRLELPVADQAMARDWYSFGPLGGADLSSITDPLDVIEQLEGSLVSYSGGEAPASLTLNPGDVKAILNSSFAGSPGDGVVSSDSQNSDSGIAYGRLVPLLIEGIKAQQTQIEALETALSELEGRVQALEDSLSE